MDKDKALELAIEYDTAARDSERWQDHAERSKKGSDYYVGLQTFSEELKEIMRREGKPALTFNEILPIINYLTSMERDNRKDVKVVKRRGGYGPVADLITELAKHTMDMCKGDFVKSDVFLNGVKGCIGWFKLEIDYDREPITGQIVLRSRPSLSVKSDPTCLSYDLNDIKSGAKFVTDSEFIYRDKLLTMYPKKQKEIDSAVDGYIAKSGRGFLQRLADKVTGNVEHSAFDDNEVLFDLDLMRKWKARVNETWIREFVPRTMICDKRKWQTWFFDPKKKADGLKIERARELASQYPQAFTVREDVSMPLLHKVVWVGDLLLEHKEDPYNGMSRFPLTPFSPFGEAQYDMGVVDNLIDPQDEVNKRMTNATHILNTTANGGHIVNELQGDYGNTLRSFGSSPGFIIEKVKCGGFYDTVKPNPLSAGHVQLSEMQKNYMEEISGVTGSSRGYEPNRQESGRLYREKVKQSMSTNQIIYDRFDESTQIMSQTLVEMLRHTKTYTEEEIGFLVEDKTLVKGDLLDNARAVVMQQTPPPPSPTKSPIFNQLSPDNQQQLVDEFVKIMEQYQVQVDTQAVEMAKEQLFEQLSDRKTGTYSTIVIQSPNAPTTQISNYYELESLREMIPPEILAPAMIDSLGIPQIVKDDIKAKLEAITQNVA